MSDLIRDVPVTNVGDIIYRQAAIDTVYGAFTFKGVGSPVDYRDIAVETLKLLPSAQRWIPVTERLPKENGDYLVTGRQGAVNKRRYEDGRWYGNLAVVAWMPLPKPWKGGAE